MGRQRGRVRRSFIAAGIGSCLLMAGLVTLTTAASAASTIEQYAVWGETGVQIGKDSTGVNIGRLLFRRLPAVVD